MGLILDSSVLISAERRDKTVRQALESISSQIGMTDVAISVVTLLEMAHGATRADSPERKAKRQQFLRELQSAVPIYPVTVPVALHTGQIDGECAARDTRIALADLLIGVTAMELGYSVATANLRHFRLIPGLNIVPL